MGFEKIVNEGNVTIRPTGDIQTVAKLMNAEQEYQQQLNATVNNAIQFSGLKAFDGNGNFSLENSRQIDIIKKVTKLQFEIKNGPSPLEQFNSWANKMMQTGKFKPGEKTYKPEIRDGSKPPIQE